MGGGGVAAIVSGETDIPLSLTTLPPPNPPGHCLVGKSPAPRGMKRWVGVRPASGADHRATQGGGVSQPNPPPPPLLLIHPWTEQTQFAHLWATSDRVPYSEALETP